MKVLIACEYSGVIRDAFAEKGCNSISCDFLPTERHGKHYQGDILDIIDLEVDFFGGHPECTYMTNSGVRWLWNKDGTKNIDRWIKLENSVNFFNMLKAKIKTGYLENPIPHKYARDGFYSVINGNWVEGIGKYSQVIQPWQFGHGETKATCLWLFNLPNLKPTDIVDGREPKVWKMFNLPKKDRWKERSRTLPGIENAMAEQWTKHIKNHQQFLVERLFDESTIEI